MLDPILHSYILYVLGLSLVSIKRGIKVYVYRFAPGWSITLRLFFFRFCWHGSKMAWTPRHCKGGRKHKASSWQLPQQQQQPPAEMMWGHEARLSLSLSLSVSLCVCNTVVKVASHVKTLAKSGEAWQTLANPQRRVHENVPDVHQSESSGEGPPHSPEFR